MSGITAFSLGRSLMRSLFKHFSEFRQGIFSESKQVATEYINQGNWSINNAAAVVYPITKSPGSLVHAGSSAIIKGITGSYSGIASKAAWISKSAVWRSVARGKGQSSPLIGCMGFAFLGFQIQPSPITNQQEHYDDLHVLLQETLKSKKTSEDTSNNNHYGNKLDKYEIGRRLGERSCNSAVYAAKCDHQEVAIKMLFNYHTTSQSTSLYRAFAKENQVLSLFDDTDQPSGLVRLPPHDNIIKILHSFADEVPNLPDALDSYPVALPSRLHTDGLGHNRTLFLVMPRYTRTLRQSIESGENNFNPQHCTLLLAQLMEGVAHMNKHGVAHRDLKSDNVLLDETVAGCPKLVITDFGSCLADNHLGLEMPFVTYETDRGGNRTLMAPEVVKAVPGPDVKIDYSKSDAWTAGTLAYEIFGQVNPFYCQGMDSKSYTQNQLPQLQGADPLVRKIVSLLLKNDVEERISAAQAATMINLYLWAPQSWLVNDIPKYSEIARWSLASTLNALKPKVICQSEKSVCPVEYEIFYNFLTSVSIEEVIEALWLFRD